ncbi:VPLPA-CTERM sorting domain-containing protein [Algirhabdus cladophorae]|uniref:VPLPA-CTERM sorting domain-containing protein n=1 Tax=Algirhabdus cladophorae TaxID=3377108 RepID=UPI003B84A4AB
MTFKKFLLFVLGLGLSALPATAETLRFDFKGEVVRTNDGTLQNNDVASIGTITTGDAVSGSFILDNSALTGGAASTFSNSSAVTNFNMVMDGLSFSTSGTGTATLRNDHMAGSSAPLRDNFFVRGTSPTGPTVGGLTASILQFSVGGTDTSVLSDTNSPTIQQFLDMFAADTIGGSLNFISFSDGSDARFEVSELKISAVPLPAGGFLLIGGLGALTVLRKRKRQS